MIDERELFGLGQRVPSRPPRPAAEVIERGMRRRRRRARVLGATCAVLVVVIGLTTTWVVQRSSESGTDTLVASGIDPTTGIVLIDGSECGGFAKSLDPAQADGLRYLPTHVPDGSTLAKAWARVETNSGSCEGPAAAVMTEPQLDGRPRSLTVYGPSPGPVDLSTLYDGYDGFAVSPVSVNGRPARIVRGSDPLGGRMFTVMWNERDGTFWQATAFGVGRQDVLAFLDELDIAPNGAVEFSEPPNDMTVTWQRTEPLGEVPTETRWWHASYEPTGGPDAERINLSIHEDPHFRLETLAALGGQTLTVDGHAAVLLNNGGQNWFLFFQVRPGVIGQMSGPNERATLVGIAESIEPVEADDPRLGE